VDERAPRNRRLFVGIALDDATRAACAVASEQLRNTGFAAKYEAPEKLHVTLAFLGNVAPSGCAEVVRALFAAAARVAPFTVDLDKFAAFPHERKPRVAYIGAREQGPGFRALAASVRGAYVALGFTFESDPVAHVTVARVKPPQRPLPSVEFAPIPLQVERLTLFESLPDREKRTSRYESVEIAPLASPPLSS
jgi:2'-5' RNA ligase